MGQKEIDNTKGWIGVATQFVTFLGYVLAILSGNPAALVLAAGSHGIASTIQAKTDPIGKKEE